MKKRETETKIQSLKLLQRTESGPNRNCDTST